MLDPFAVLDRFVVVARFAVVARFVAAPPLALAVLVLLGVPAVFVVDDLDVRGAGREEAAEVALVDVAVVELPFDVDPARDGVDRRDLGLESPIGRALPTALIAPPATLPTVSTILPVVLPTVFTTSGAIGVCPRWSFGQLKCRWGDVHGTCRAVARGTQRALGWRVSCQR